MASRDGAYGGKSFTFDPEKIESRKFFSSVENPSSDVSKEIINDVISEIMPAFSDEGVPSDVLQMLQSLWIQKLQKIPADHDDMALSSDSDASFHGYTDVELAISPHAKSLSAASKEREELLKATGAIPKTSKKIMQVDGPNDSSSSDEDINDDDDISDGDASDDDDDDDDDNEDGEDDEGPEEEPLGSGDDISEGDPSDLFNTENVVVCQYDKITRTRNKWKFHLKDGIMNLNGKDYVFQKATGEAEW